MKEETKNNSAICANTQCATSYEHELTCIYKLTNNKRNHSSMCVCACHVYACMCACLLLLLASACIPMSTKCCRCPLNEWLREGRRGEGRVKGGGKGMEGGGGGKEGRGEGRVEGGGKGMEGGGRQVKERGVCEAK